jgi:hypothetical protein
MAARSFHRAKDLLGGNQKIDVVVFGTFGSIHAADFSVPFSTA